MNEIAKQRIAEILALQNILQGAWHSLKVHLEGRRRELLIELVAKNDDEKRGRIKEINDLLELPERLQQEAMSLQEKPQEPAEYP